MKSKLKMVLAVFLLIFIAYDVYWFLQGEPSSNILMSIIKCIVYFMLAIYFISDFVQKSKNK